MISLDVYPDWMFQTLKVCAIIIWLDNLSAFPLTVLRCEGRAKLFISTKIAGAIIQTGFTIWFLLIGRGVAGVIEANLISSIFVFILTLPTLFGRLRFVFDKVLFTSCLMFGIPNVPNVLFVQVIEFSNGKVLELLRDANEAGLYRNGHKLGMFLAVVAMGFRLAWQPFFMRIKDQPDAREIFARVLTYLIALTWWIYLGLTAFVGPLVRIKIPIIETSFIDPQYWAGLPIFPIVLLAHVFDVMYAVFVVGIYMEKKTKILPWITGVAALINVFGNILLVPTYGMWASAWLMVASYAVMALLLYIYVQKVYPVPWEWNRVIHISFLAFMIYMASFFGRKFNMDWIGYFLSVIFPMILLFAGIASQSEKGHLKRFLRIS